MNLVVGEADKTPPSAPTGLHVTAKTQTSMTISWNPSTDNVGVVGYSVSRNGTVFGTTASTAASLKGLACGKSYAVGVSAYDASSNHSPTESITASTSSCDRGTTLAPGQTLTAGEYLLSANQQYKLAMQSDGNLVEYQGSTPLWASKTAGNNGATATMQSDGNLVVNLSGVAKWASQTNGFAGSRFILQDDSNLVIYQGSHALWTAHSGYVADHLYQGATLQPNQALVSQNHTYRLVMQYDGNLVEYRGSTPLWASNTAGDNGATVTMQNDGNLVIYMNGVAKWASNTNGFSGAYLVLQNDANAVVYDGSHPVWVTNRGYIGDHLYTGITLQPGQELISQNASYRLVMQYDGNLVEYKGSTPLWASNTAGDNGATVTMQATDGNLVIYQNGIAKWASNTGGHPGAFLVLQNDSNTVVYSSGGSALWANNGGRGGTGSIAAWANGQLGVQDTPWNTYCNPYSAHFGRGATSYAGVACASGTRSELWCADFAEEAWQQAGADVSGITAASASFYNYGVAHGTWHPIGSGYTPQPGDVAVYGSPSSATHVGIVVSNGSSGPNVINGDWETAFPSAFPTAVAYEANETDSDPGAGDGKLSGYTSPVG